MKTRVNLGTLIVVVLLMAGCSGGGYDRYRGQLLGELDRPNWSPTMPYGMVYVPTGQLHIGQSDQDVNSSMWQKAKSVSIQGFYMDDTEITNNEYRQFVHWVRDSIAHTILEHYQEPDINDNEWLDWTVQIEWESPEVREALDEMYVPFNQRIGGKDEINTGVLSYDYWEIDWRKASMAKVTKVSRLEVIDNDLSIKAYPDTLVWIRDFTYSYNEPMARNYFHHPAFDDYPVVGVTWEQANAFCHWRTKFYGDYLKQREMVLMDKFRLPTETEWEYAARGGKDLAQYPWGGPYVRNSKGCILANFKPGRGNYPEDGGFYTVRADAYWPNDWGLYNMAGNVAEWTSTAFYEGAYTFIHDLNPDIQYDAEPTEAQTLHRKVLRGGSWKDIGYYIQTGSRHWEFEDSCKSYIGFRCVSTFLGRDHNDRP